jgi:hypothetical protein
MALRRPFASLALPVLVVALIAPFSPVAVTPAAAEDSARPAGGTLYLTVRGKADRQPGTAPDRLAYVLDVYDTNNQKIGTVTHDAAFTSATTADLVSTFHLPDGDLVNHATEAFAPDTSRQNMFLTGVHPDRDTIQGAKSTGAYAGRSGRLRMSGWHDGSTFPQTLGTNDFYAIDLNS